MEEAVWSSDGLIKAEEEEEEEEEDLQMGIKIYHLDKERKYCYLD